jgi:hypothetical protein
MEAGLIGEADGGDWGMEEAKEKLVSGDGEVARRLAAEVCDGMERRGAARMRVGL